MTERAAYSSSGSFFSSIAMSLNSLDSKTSRHSWHSTYSVSSSRETICTRGCLHGSGAAFFWGDGEGWLGVINSLAVHLDGIDDLWRFGVILLRLAMDVKCCIGWQWPSFSTEPPPRPKPSNSLRASAKLFVVPPRDGAPTPGAPLFRAARCLWRSVPFRTKPC